MTAKVTPDPFHLVNYDTEQIRALVDDIAAQIDFPRDVAIELTVDEALPHPILATFADVDDGVARLWVAGGNFEARDHPRAFSELHARADITHMLLRARDRLVGGFETAPPEAEVALGERAAWDAYTWGRLARLGHPVHEQKRRYDFRMQHGFNDASDAAFERLWSAESMTWAGVQEICAETGAVGRPKPKTAIDLLRVTG
ncbi:MAG: hypothetical protein ACXVIH_04440 [Ilumatobacteraceae bacterium]